MNCVLVAECARPKDNDPEPTKTTESFFQFFVAVLAIGSKDPLRLTNKNILRNRDTEINSNSRTNKGKEQLQNIKT